MTFTLRRNCFTLYKIKVKKNFRKIWYNDLVRIFPGIVEIIVPYLQYKDFVSLPENEKLRNEYICKHIVYKNMRDLEQNKKPEGISFASQNIKLIFPICDDNIKFYIYATNGQHRLADKLSKDVENYLWKNDIEYNVHSDKLEVITKSHGLAGFSSLYSRRRNKK